MSFVIQSSAFAAGQPIPRRHTGDGEDLSPPLEWQRAFRLRQARSRSLSMIPMLRRASPGFTG